MGDKITYSCSKVYGLWYIVFLLLCKSLVLASGKVNYCSSKMCSDTNAHTFCQYAEGPGDQCIGYIQAPLSNHEKARVLTRLNQRRAAAASGRLKGFPTAGNMLKLLWIDELAREAQLWADQCESPNIPEENDACRDLYAVTVGQCVASVLGEAPGLKPETMVDMWYMQSRHYKGNVTYYEQPSMSFGFYGDFAQLVYAKAYMVGCGRSRFMVQRHGRMRSVERLVCNFAPRGPLPSHSIWTVAGPATVCPPRSQPDENFPALCAIQPDLDESQDQDNIMSIEEHVLLDTISDIEKNASLNYIGSVDELFLTKIAIASLENFGTTTSDIILQKRDILIMDDEEALNLTEEIINNKIEVINNPEIISKTVPNVIFPLEKIKLIGRPKSYNMEELNNFNLDSKYDNPDSSLEDTPNRATTLGIDYEYVENIETTTLTTLLQTTAESGEEMNTNSTIIVENESLPSLLVTVEYWNISEESIITDNITEAITEIKETTNILDAKNINESTISVNESDAIIDEYLNDPETFRQLQEELARMEQTISAEISPTDRSEKIRRDLRGRPEDRTESLQTGTESTTSHIQQLVDMLHQEEKNRTLDQTPMFNMVMKYMPYLKDYKKGIFKTAVGKSCRAINSHITTLVLTIILINVL